MINFFTLVLLFLTFKSYATPVDIKEISTIKEAYAILKRLDHNSLVIFDIDQTLLTSKDERYLITQNDKDSISIIIDEYTNGCKADYNKLEEHPIDYFIEAERVLMEEEYLDFIKEIKSRNTPIIALTQLKVGRCRNIESLEEWRFVQLKNAGLDFSDSFKMQKLEFKKFPLFNQTYPIYYKGILMTNDVSKGNLLVEFLKEIEKITAWKPNKIYFFDDKLHHNESVSTSLKNYNISATCYHYIKGDEIMKTIDDKKAKAKINYFLKDLAKESSRLHG